MLFITWITTFSIYDTQFSKDKFEFKKSCKGSINYEEEANVDINYNHKNKAVY